MSAPTPFFKCRWLGDDSLSVEVFVISWPDEEAARSSLNTYASPIRVDGVGELAVTSDGVDLAFIQGTFEININLWPVEYWGERADQRLEATRQLGVAIVPRLP